MSVLSTMVFADISGSASLYEAMGNERAAEAVKLAGACRAESAQSDYENRGVVSDAINQRSAFRLAGSTAANGMSQRRRRRVSLYQFGP